MEIAEQVNIKPKNSTDWSSSKSGFLSVLTYFLSQVKELISTASEPGSSPLPSPQWVL